LVRVKICGNRNDGDVAAAVAGGADAIGLIVGARYATDDEISPESADALRRQVPVMVTPVLVTHLETAALVIALHRRVPAPAVQLHGDVALGEVAAIRSALPSVMLIKAVHVVDRSAIDSARVWASRVDAVLLDTRTADRIGGTGQIHDWSISAEIVKSVGVPVILAGGLTFDNVAAAVARVRPYAVDVNSGVNGEGAKDPLKVRRFVTAAKSDPVAGWPRLRR
jgi:phosphoribosylanthranilate isomerase